MPTPKYTPADRIQELIEKQHQRYGTPLPTPIVPGTPVRTPQSVPTGIEKIGTPLSHGLIPNPRRNLANIPRNTSADAFQERLNALMAKKTKRDEQAPVGPDFGDLMSQIEAILNKQHGTPDRWVSPYTQDMLNQMAAGIQQTGDRASQEYLTAINEINSLYGQGRDSRATGRQAFVDELAANASNIGVDYAQGSDAKQLAADAGFLDEMSVLNQNTDVAFNQNMSRLARDAANQLAQSARQGLLTPKQFIQGNNDISPTDKIRIGMLQDELAYQRQLESDNADRAAQRELAMIPEITLNAQEDRVQTYPEVIQGIAGLENPQLSEYAKSIWDRSENDPVGALSLLEEEIRNNNDLLTNATMERTGPLGLPTPTNVADMLKNQIGASKNQALLKALQEFYRQYSPGYGGQTTGRSMTDKSKRTYQ